jgi:hypothetical protein
MKKLFPNVAVLLLLFSAFLYSQTNHSEDLGYWNLLSHHLVLNPTLAIIGIAIGFMVKKYSYVLVGASLVLLIYCLAFIFENNTVDMKSFFLALYSLFLAFSATANLVRYFLAWFLAEDSKLLSS